MANKAWKGDAWRLVGTPSSPMARRALMASLSPPLRGGGETDVSLSLSPMIRPFVL